MLLGTGAEAEIHLEDGVIIKRRVPKGYRHPELDRKIRYERTRSESRLMSKVGGTPKILETGDCEIVMEFVDGKKLRDLGNLDGLEEPMGRAVGRLHSQGVAHNDLTTSNMILHKGEIVLIDFGLAARGKTEDFATDLKVLFEAAEATHKNFSRDLFLRGYAKTMPDRSVINRLDKVYSRGRYITRSQ